MKISGVVQKQGAEYFLVAEQGKYKIHPAEGVAEEWRGLKAEAEDAPEIYPPKNAVGWVKIESLVFIFRGDRND